jgi:hypothetical protein
VGQATFKPRQFGNHLEGSNINSLPASMCGSDRWNQLALGNS